MKHSYYTSRILFVFTVLLFSLSSYAQMSPGRYFNASLGFGYSYPQADINVGGSGFYAQGEYVYNLTRWFGIRPYAGLVITSPDENDDPQIPSNYEVYSKAFLLGGKARIAAPIRWIAPYMELGLGASLGSFKTITPVDNIKKSGVLMHVPFTIGLALGRNNNLELGFTYYYHNAAQQYNGAFAFGYSFPLD